MSIKTTKRMALGVIASLVFAPLVAVAPAGANTAVAGTVTIDPVRVSFTGAAQDTVSAAAVTWTSTGTFALADLVDTKTAVLTVTLTEAPTAAAVLTVTKPADYGTTVDATAQLGGAASFTGAVDKADGGNGFNLETIALATEGIGFNASVAGTYRGTITVDGDNSAATNVLTAPFVFTTVGAPKTIEVSKSSVEWAAINTVTATNTITLKDASGKTTQSSTVDTLSVTISASTDPAGANIALTTGATLDDSALKDGTVTYTLTSNGTADSETVTVTPLGTLPGLGVAAVTFTAKTMAVGAVTNADSTLTAPSSSTVVKSVTGTPASYNTDPSVSTFEFTVTGLVAGSAYKIGVVSDDAGAQTVVDNVANTTAATINNDGTTASMLYGLVPASGSVKVTVSGSIANGKFIKVDGNGDGDYTDASDSVVTALTAAYAASISTPAVTPTLQVNETAISVSGKIVDTYGNPLSGATVKVTAVTDDTADTDPTAETATDAAGLWSVTLAKVSAKTTSAQIAVDGTKTGATITDITAGGAGSVTVNFSATGNPTAMTFTNVSADTQNPDTATTAPQVEVVNDGTATNVSDEQTTIATGATATGAVEAGDELARFTVATTPGAQVKVTASSNALLYTATGGTVAEGKLTLDVAAGDNVYVAVKTHGVHTITFTSGNITKSWKVYGVDTIEANQGEQIRNLSVDKASVSLKPGEFTVLTIKASDAFGNAIKSAVAAANVVVTVKGAGSALVEGPTLSKQFTTTDADGNIMVGVIASQTPGSGSITISGTGGQLGAAVGAVTGTTAGTNGLTASVASVTVSVIVEAPEVVYEKPTLSFAKSGGRIILSGTAVDGEGDIIIYVKSVGKTGWVEKAKTLEVASPGDFNGSIRGFRNDKVIRVKQEGTGLFSNQIIVKANR
jgi:hypothetical protein